ncbi:MAG: hypothetical protein DRJ37_02090 [Thermoprotei archaeon]|nr:MAG: hypothetical protein DRJ37_02090 [Thermoprotei archaeon]
MQPRILLHSSYILSRLSKELTAAMAGLAIIQVIFLSMMAPRMAIRVTLYPQPGYVAYPQPPQTMLTPVLGITSFLYAILTIAIGAQMGLELERGDSALYLSHPISRLSYVASWIIASILIPSLMFFFSLIIPILILEPYLLLGVGGGEITLILLQVSTSGSIVLLTAALFKKRSLALAVGIFEYLIAPILLTLIAAITSSITQTTPSARDMLWMAVLHPYNYYLMFGYSGANWVEAAVVNIPVFSAFVAFLLAYTRRSFEVK